METWLEYIAFLFVLICLAKPIAAYRTGIDLSQDAECSDRNPDRTPEMPGD